jgi:hypothetical protein
VLRPEGRLLILDRILPTDDKLAAQLAVPHVLIAEGHLSKAEIPETDGFRPPTDQFIDAIPYDGRSPNDYLAKLPIGLKDALKPTAKASLP